MTDLTATYQKLLTELREVSILGSVSSLLGWDEQVMLRPSGMDFRSKQAALLARLTHERFTAPVIGEWLTQLEAEPGDQLPDDDAAVVVREARRDYNRATKLPTTLVEEIARVTTLSQSAWQTARAKNDFQHFAPWLTTMLKLKREEAACIGSVSGNPYDALLDQYEPGETADSLDTIFQAMKPRLVALIQRIAGSSRKSPADILERAYAASTQEKLAKQVALKIGFDGDAGRLDVSVHPFCSGIAPGDTRITTRYDEKYFVDSFFGTLHETGHALYEQGLPKAAHFGTGLAEATSLGIHESQSRLWENLVGRGRAFWRYFLPQVRAAFEPTLADVTAAQWMFAINDVRPSFIRTEADEATYNLHILLRFEIEQKMLRGDLEVPDVPAAWNQSFKSYFGLDVPDDARGCLQDVHWSCGHIGYFPTYALGNMYAAQFFEQAKLELGDLDEMFERGDFATLRTWLHQNVHQHGRRYRGRELAMRITGKPVSPDALLDHLEAKGREYYGV